MKTRLVLLPVLLGLAKAFSQDAVLPALIVKPLDGDLSQIQGWQPALGEGLAEMLVTELSKINKFELLEASAMKDLINEIDLGEAGYVAKEEKVKKGGFKGADFLFVGKVTRFGGNNTGVGAGGIVPGSLGSFAVKRSKNEVQIDWRVVDIATRRILKTGKAIGTHTGVGFKIGADIQGTGAQIGYQNKDFMNSALGKATVIAVSNIVGEVAQIQLPASGRRQQQVATVQRQAAEEQKAADDLKAAQESLRKNAKGKVLAVPAKGVLIVSIGSAHGFKAGDILSLRENMVTKDEQGNVLFEEEGKEAGEIKLQTVQEERSRAAYEGDLDVRIGWIVRTK